MKNIIIHPTDFSECANKALDYAIYMAKALNCKIKVVHSLVFNDLGEFRQNPTALIADSKKVEKEAEENLKKIGKKVKANEVECEMTIYTGKISAWFSDFADENNPLLIVMGTTGAGNIANKLFGSNTFSIIKKTKSPVLAVPEKATLQQFNKFIFATDYKDIDVDSISILSKIAKYKMSQINIVHILDNDSTKKENNQKLLDNLKANVEETVDYKNIEYKLYHCEDISKGIQLLIKETNPDLFALVMRKQNFFERFLFGSFTEKMVYHTETPLLVFPERT